MQVSDLFQCIIPIMTALPGYSGNQNIYFVQLLFCHFTFYEK